jgi:arylformamidase
MIYDLSPPLGPGLGVWPGDTPLSRRVACEIGRGANITLSSITTTLHLGAHADGPNHYAHPAPGVGERSLAHYLGACQVIDAPVARGSRVGPGDLRQALLGRAGGAERVLLKTGTFPNPMRWNADFAGVSVELVEVLGAAGVITIGLDTPSVDVQESKDLPAHRAIAARDMAILEGLVLDAVPAGVYELIALPLRLVGMDASPVRAVLRTLTASRSP